MIVAQSSPSHASLSVSSLSLSLSLLSLCLSVCLCLSVSVVCPHRSAFRQASDGDGGKHRCVQPEFPDPSQPQHDVCVLNPEQLQVSAQNRVPKCSSHHRRGEVLPCIPVSASKRRPSSSKRKNLGASQLASTTANRIPKCSSRHGEELPCTCTSQRKQTAA